MARAGKRRRGPVKPAPAGGKVSAGRVSSGGGSLFERAPLDEGQVASARKRFFWAVTVALLLFGIYGSVRFYRFAPFPHPDSTSFINTGQKLLSLEMPSSFKRAPVVCVLQAGVSRLLPVERPDYHAGMVLNALLYPLLVVLLWWVGRELIGDLAAFPAVVLAVNPWLLVRLTESIAETAMIFFSLATMYLISRRSKWAYVLAAAATMTRYDLAGWILAVMVVDFIEASDKRERLRVVLRGAAAALPLAIWILITYLTWEQVASQSHYISHYTSDRPLRIGVYFQENWRGAISPLLRVPGGELSFAMAGGPAFLTKVLLAVLFTAGVVTGVVKRRWEVAAMLAFFVPYLVVHAMRDSFKVRYYAVNHWLIFFICVLGVQGIWSLMRSWGRGLSRVVLPIVQILVAAAAAIWTAALGVELGRMMDHPGFSMYFSRIGWLPVATILLVVGFAVLRHVFYRGTTWGRDIATAAVICLMLMSSQFSTAQVLNDGKREHEFVELAEWFRQHTEPGEKLACTLAHAVRFIAQDRADDLIDTEVLGREYLREHGDVRPVVKYAVFTRDCLERGVDYVAWDSRLGYAPNNSYYKARQLEKVAFLVEFIPERIKTRQFPVERPREEIIIPDVKLPEGELLNQPLAEYEYVTTTGDVQTGLGASRHIHVFRLKRVTR